MTNAEAKKILEAYIACESKKAHFECSEYNCGDDCPLLYDMGTVGEYNEAIDMAIQALEQEPCEDCISRQEAIDANCYNCSIKANGGKCSKCDAVKAIENLSSVKPQEKTGHWIFVDKAKEHAHCSDCDYGNVDLFDGRPHNYCPNCGAKMFEPQESEE